MSKEKVTFDDQFLKKILTAWSRQQKRKKLEQWAAEIEFDPTAVEEEDEEEEEDDFIFRDELIHAQRQNKRQQLEAWSQEQTIVEASSIASKQSKRRNLPLWKIAASVVVLISVMSLVIHFLMPKTVVLSEQEDSVDKYEAAFTEFKKSVDKPYRVTMGDEEEDLIEGEEPVPVVIETVKADIVKGNYVVAATKLQEAQEMQPDSLVGLTLAYVLILQKNEVSAQKALTILDTFQPDLTSVDDIDGYKALAYLVLKDRKAITQLYETTPPSQLKDELKKLLPKIE
jgi:hypothetical protein